MTQERIDQLKAVGVDFKDTQQKRNVAKWQSKLELLRQYQEQYGHCNVPEVYKIDGVKLGSWLGSQRREYKNLMKGMYAPITQERIEQLEAIGFDFKASLEKREEAHWQTKLQLLQQYQEWNGHCNVPQIYEVNGVKLGRWLCDQWSAYKKHSEGKPAKITQERIDQLEAIGLDFNEQKSDEAQWQSKLELLRQYQEQHGHCTVPIMYEINGVKLGLWLSDQRKEYKELTMRASHHISHRSESMHSTRLATTGSYEILRTGKMKLFPETKRHLL